MVVCGSDLDSPPQRNIYSASMVEIIGIASNTESLAIAVVHDRAGSLEYLASRSANKSFIGSPSRN
jgi:hypothetical protein